MSKIEERETIRELEAQLVQLRIALLTLWQKYPKDEELEQTCRRLLSDDRIPPKLENITVKKWS